VEFYYKGEFRKNNCEHWQDIVKNPVAISDDFCRNELPKYTFKTCRCTDPEGKQVVWSAPSAAPSKGAEESEEESPASSMAHSSISTSLVLVGTLALLGMQL
jgi:hypothetical protein